jgi:hypothetical protein
VTATCQSISKRGVCTFGQSSRYRWFHGDGWHGLCYLGYILAIETSVLGHVDSFVFPPLETTIASAVSYHPGIVNSFAPRRVVESFLGRLPIHPSSIRNFGFVWGVYRFPADRGSQADRQQRHDGCSPRSRGLTRYAFRYG